MRNSINSLHVITNTHSKFNDNGMEKGDFVTIFKRISPNALIKFTTSQFLKEIKQFILDEGYIISVDKDIVTTNSTLLVESFKIIEKQYKRK